MGTTTRHFTALMRKNFINWKREPFSAICQLICPGLLMLILVYARSRIDPSSVDAQGLVVLGTAQYTIDVDQTTSTLDIKTTDARLAGFNQWYHYDLALEPTSPLTFNPANCMLNSSFVIPRVASSIIAVVGADSYPVMARISNTLTAYQSYWQQNQVNNLTIKQFATMSDLQSYISSEQYLYPNEGVCFGVFVSNTSTTAYTSQFVFDDQTQYGGSVSVGIPPTKDPAWLPYSSQPNLKDYKMLSNYGYAFIQNIAANAILQESTQNDIAHIDVLNIPVPAEQLFVDQFQSILSGLFPFFLLLIYMGPIYNCTYGIVQEKEQKSKESMRMMGLSDTAYWLSWFCFYSIQATIIALIGWLCLCINVITGDTGYIFLYMWLFGLCIFGQVVFYQAIFTRAKYAGLIACLIFFMISFLNTPIANSQDSGLKLVLSLVPQVCIQQMAVIWSDFETSQIGINSTTARQVVAGYTFMEGLWMMIAGLIFWSLIGFYLDAVLPKQFGTRRHPCFMFFPSTYTGCCKKGGAQIDEDEQERRSTLLRKDNEEAGGMELRNLKVENYEGVAAEIARQALDGNYLRIEGLEKTYDNGFQAVKGINLKIYQNQIFALLGQNGAGKTTTISMLTGLIESSKGSAIAYNNDMFKEADKVRQIMGVCPQHDILFENLTPVEHLRVFYDFKGGNPELKEKEIADLIKDVGLTIDQHKMAGSLSGGNKRKLSVAIALCGGSKLVLLDEPTAGMDLGARRDLWNMLKNYRRDKIIILTTHYMDEADVLGDRIGIMAQGQMMCLGTSLFLKKRFGAGYKITMVKSTKQPNQLIEPYLKEHLGHVELLSEVSSEITFQVPNDSAKNFKTFFERFDREVSGLGITSYGVSITTLEEVFLKINQEFQINIGNSAVEDRLSQQTGQKIEDLPQTLDHETRNSLLQNETHGNDEEIQENEERPRLVGNAQLSDTVKALLVKRFHLYKRDRTGICCEVVVPFVMVLIGCIINGIDLSQKSPLVSIAPSLYPTPQRIIVNQNLIQTLDINDVSPSTLVNNLPGGTGSFTPTYNGTDLQENFFQNYYLEVYNARNLGDALPYRYGSYQIYSANKANNIYQFATYLNLTSSMSTAYYPQFMYESILKTAANVDYTANTSPFPPMFQLTERSSSQNAFAYAGFVGFAFAFIPCAMISFILIERVENLRHMQLISGMSLASYWLSNMIADIIKVYIPIFMIMLLSLVFKANYDGVWVLYLLYPLALVPFTYVTSFLFIKDSTAQIITLLTNYFVCCVMSVLIFVLQFIPQTFKLGGILRWAFCIFPGYCVINGIIWSSNGAISLQIRATNPDYPQLSDNIWAMSNLGGDALILALHFVIDTLILIAIEKNWFSCLKNFTTNQVPPRNQNLVLDPDVLQEEQRVSNNRNDVIRVADFRKAYTTTFGTPALAVERISFGLDYGECFALLGVNGAGKSTTFKSLTADTTPTEGEITVAGFNIQTQFEEARQLIGYCPQKDAIFTLMTVEEHLWFYARIKGIPSAMHLRIVETAIIELNLSDHRTKPAGTLSGGNKRKLSVAIATLGNPPIILLDEPSAGMDPEARRFMWTVVERISQRDKKSAVILTTHSMEEAEALSTKMGIMVRGGIFKCYGSSQHIKNKYGTGYEAEIKIRKPSYNDLEQLAERIGFKQQIEQRVDLNQAKQTAKIANVDEMILDQIKEGGLGSDLVFESSQGGAERGANTVRVSNFVSYVYAMQYGFKVINLLSTHFSRVELIEQCSDFFKFRIPREDKTIGYLFGLIEDQKKDCNISEYSVSQTSLEQIFQTFANQSINEDKATLAFRMDKIGNLQLEETRRSTLKTSEV